MVGTYVIQIKHYKYIGKVTERKKSQFFKYGQVVFHARSEETGFEG